MHAGGCKCMLEVENMCWRLRTCAGGHKHVLKVVNWWRSRTSDGGQEHLVEVVSTC